MQIIDAEDLKCSPILDYRRFCQDCESERTSHGWCKSCETSYMILGFSRWTTENRDLDNLIRNTQRNAAQTCDYLEYIDFKEFVSIEFVSKGGFSTVYKADWLEGPRWNWDEIGQMWCRSGPITVALKRLDNSQNISSDFINQVEKHHRCLQSGSLADCFGITRDPTGAYMFVMRFYENGNLYQYLDKSKGIISWRDMVDMLWGVAGGLERIHAENRIHSNLHGGNLLIEDEAVSTDARIADVGLHGPADQPKSSSQIYGVLPFIAPEVLLGEKPTQASDIYSFGIIMCTLATGKRPFSYCSHDFNLAKEICFNNLRPDISEIINDMPKSYYEWMVKCWDADPRKRPTASQLNELLGEWITSICDDPNPSIIADQFSNADERRWELIGKHMNKNHSPYIHPGAYYISRPIDFFRFENFCNF